MRVRLPYWEQMAAPDFQARLVRVLTILRLIAGEPGQWTRARLAQRFRVSSRSIDNDLLAIRRAGYVIRRRGKAYVIDQDEPHRSVSQRVSGERSNGPDGDLHFLSG